MTTPDWTMVEVLNEYERLIKKLNPRAAAERYPTASKSPGILQSTAHLLFMLERIPDLPKFDKQMRWICFIQGVLWNAGVLSVDEASDHNLALLNGDISA